MTDPWRDRRGPLPLDDVLGIVERRARHRTRVRAAAAAGGAVGAAGLAGVIVLVLQQGPGPTAPAAPPAALATSPSRTAPATPPPVTTLATVPADPPDEPPPFDPGWLSSGYLEGLANAIPATESEAERTRLVEAATAIENAWGLDFYPSAKAIAFKADILGVSLDVDNPSGDDELVNRFADAGYTEVDAAELASAWGSDTRTAKVMGAVLIEAGICCG